MIVFIALHVLRFVFRDGVTSELDKPQSEPSELAEVSIFPGRFGIQSRHQALVDFDLQNKQPIEATSCTLDIPHIRMCATSFRKNHIRKLSIRGVISHHVEMACERS